MIEEMMTYYLPVWLHDRWIFAAIVFSAFFLLSRLFVYIIEKVVIAFTSRTKTRLDDILVERTNKPVSWLLIFIGIKIAIEFLHYENGFTHYINRTTTSLIYIGTGILVISVIVVLIDFWGNKMARKTKSSMDDALIPLFRKTTKVVLLVILAIMVLDLWGINVTGLLAGVGIAGIAIGFAVKDSLSNIFGGVSLILDKSIHVGDKIELEDGTVALVEDVGIRATRLKTFDNEILIVPNGSMSTMRLKNYNQPDKSARVVVPIGIEYGADPEKAKKVALDEIKKIKDILPDPEPSAILLELADFSLNMKAFFWVDDISKVYPKREEALIRIYKAYAKKKIGIPFPTQTVEVKKK
ncbi:mechanosensitive ion channel family protein [Candidatus Woesearchaeota archaeon]|nr:mechanosensitive ion channel family protein [Candidatus Woesearchaeota archaeon]